MSISKKIFVSTFVLATTLSLSLLLISGCEKTTPDEAQTVKSCPAENNKPYCAVKADCPAKKACSVDTNKPCAKKACPADCTKPCCAVKTLTAAIPSVEQTICPIMGKPINKDIFVEYKGQKVYFCCPGCVEKFNADPEKYLEKLPNISK